MADWEPLCRSGKSSLDYLRTKPRPRPKPNLNAEDTDKIAEEIAYMRALGCTREQIERHRTNLEHNAAKPKRGPKQPEAPIVRGHDRHPYRMELAVPPRTGPNAPDSADSGRKRLGP